ncbi:MAG: acyltransferase [Bacteroidetes bacterium]|nr:acyltransferase [Bacteroidota bacterium]
MNLPESADKTSTLRERYPLADFLRGIAIILMIQVHIMELFATEDIFSSWIGRISLFLGGSPAAPMFMIIMGYFAATSRKNFSQQFVRGIKLFFGGLILNIGLNFSLLWKIYKGELALDPLPYIFGADILPLAGLSLIALAIIKKCFSEKFAPQLILLVTVLIITEIVNHFDIQLNGTSKYVLSFFIGVSEWSYFPFFTWFAYPLLGFIINSASEKSLFKESLSKKNLIIVLSVILVFVLLSFEWSISISSDLQRYYHHGTLFFIWCLVLLIGWTIIFYFIHHYIRTNNISRYVQWLGRNVTAVYVFQWLLIGNIATQIYRTQELIQSSVWFFAILCLTSILTHFWVKYRS